MRWNKKVTVLLTAITLCAAVLSGCGSNSESSDGNNQAAENNDRNYITASGVLEADTQYTVTTTVTEDIIDDPFEEGQTVHAGDLLYVLKQDTIQNNISKAKLAIENAELSKKTSEDNLRKLSVKSDFSGTVTKLYASEGSQIQAGTKLADIIDNSKMTLTVPFIADNMNGIYVGQSANVSIVGTFYNTVGTVTDISSGSLTQNGSNVRMVEITITNPGTLKKGDMGTATIGNIAASNSGEFDNYLNGEVIAEISGKLLKNNVSEGDRLNVGSVVATLSNDSIETQANQAEIALKDARLNLENLNNQLSNYNITSEIDGVVIKKNVSKNDTISAANMASLATIADLSKIIVKVNVDELDVTQIQIGDRVSITADSAPDREYSGVVEFIGQSGTQVNGVALYEIKISIENPENLMPGMNVTTKFNLSQKGGNE